MDLQLARPRGPRAPHHRRAPGHRLALHGRPHARRRRDRAADDHRGALMSGVVEAALAKAVTIPSSTIHAHVESLRRKHPQATPEQVIRLLEKEYLLVVQGTGGAVGATAAAPARRHRRGARPHRERRGDVLRCVGGLRARGGQRARHRGRGLRPTSRAAADHDPRRLRRQDRHGRRGADHRQRRQVVADADADGDRPQGEHDDDPALRAYAGHQADRPGVRPHHPVRHRPGDRCRGARSLGKNVIEGARQAFGPPPLTFPA